MNHLAVNRADKDRLCLCFDLRPEERCGALSVKFPVLGTS